MNLTSAIEFITFIDVSAETSGSIAFESGDTITFPSTNGIITSSINITIVDLTGTIGFIALINVFTRGSITTVTSVTSAVE